MPENVSFSRSDFQELWREIENGSEYPLRVTGSSMYPFLIHDVSTVTIRKPESYCFKKGQILLFITPDGSYVLHRVFRVIDGDQLLMNGDHLTRLEPITTKAVCAVVTKIRRKKRTVSVDSVYYRALVWIWMTLYPCRKTMFKAGRTLRSALRHPNDANKKGSE